MDRVIAPNTVPFGSHDTAPGTGTPGMFTSGNPVGAIPATVVPGWFLNMLEEEQRNVVIAAGLTPDRTNWGQLGQGIQALIAAEATARSSADSAEATARNSAIAAEAAARSGADSTEATARNNADVAEANARASAIATVMANFANYYAGSTFGGSGSGSAGYLRIPNSIWGNFLFQWGTGGTSTGNGDLVTYPIAFPGNCFGVIVNESQASGWGTSPLQPTIYGVGSLNQGAFTVYAARMAGGTTAQYQGGLGFRFFAWGV